MQNLRTYGSNPIQTLTVSPTVKYPLFFWRLPFSFSTCHFKHVPVKKLTLSSFKGSLGSMNHCSNIKEFVAQYCRGWNITWALYHVNACNNVALIVVSLCIKLRSGKISKDSFSRLLIGGSLSGTKLTNRRQCVCKLFIRWFQAMPWKTMHVAKFVHVRLCCRKKNTWWR